MLHYNLNFVIASTVFASLTLFGLFNALLFLRKKFPIRVNCWFCNTNLRVPYNEWNSFTCPKCQQYNGFNEDGSYNREIPEQHYSKFNTNQFCQRKFIERLPASNGFCEFCSRNQELKIHQLANFRPRCEDKYDEEIEEFREKLEDSYQLCHSCQSHLGKTLNKIKTKFIGSKLSQLSAKLNKNLNKTAKILIDDDKILSYFISSIILILSIANFIRDMKIDMSSITNDERILNIINHIHVFLYTVFDIITSRIKDMKLNDLIESVDIDKIAASALILNFILIFNDLKKIKLPVILSLLFWSVKMMMNEIPFDASREMSIKGIVAVTLIISSIYMFKEKKIDQLDMSNNASFQKIPTENYEDSDTEVDLSETSSFFDYRSNMTAYSKSSRLNSSFRSSYAEPIKTLNSTMMNKTKPVDVSSNKSFSIAKEVLSADRNQVQKDINRLKLSEKNDDIFSTSSTIKEFNSFQNPFCVDRSRKGSPTPSVASLFSTSTRTQLISPPRLHSPLVYTCNSNQSWIGGGYWTSPQKNYLNGVMNQTKPVISRSSSQSSGVGTIDESDKNSRDDSMTHEETTSLFSDVTSQRRNLFEMPLDRSFFNTNQFFNQPKNHHSLFNNTYNNSSFRNYRESKAFFK